MIAVKFPARKGEVNAGAHPDDTPAAAAGGAGASGGGEINAGAHPDDTPAADGGSAGAEGGGGSPFPTFGSFSTRRKLTISTDLSRFSVEIMSSLPST